MFAVTKGLSHSGARILLLLATLLLWSVPHAFAQTPATPAPGGEGPDYLGGDPTQDIFIEGIGFSKLAVALDLPVPLPSDAAFRTTLRLLEKNLCWSGLFNLHGGTTRYCALRGEPQRVDMRLAVTTGEKVLELRLKDAGPEGVVLFEAQAALQTGEDERPFMDLVNRMAERLTGGPGILGTTIAFVLRQPRYNKIIAATNTHGALFRPLSFNRDISLLPRWAPNGSALVYTILTRNGTQVYFHNLEPNANGLGPSRFLNEPGGLNTGGAFAPDGKRLIMTLSPNQNADLFEYNLERNTLRQLTSRSGIETQADWSRDGRKIVFVSDRSGTPQVYLLDLETNEDLRLTFDTGYNADPRFSPDSRLILFTKRVDDKYQIFIMDINGENVRQITRGRFDAEQPDWSPDGHQIVFTSNRTGDFKIYVVSTDGSNLRRLTDTPAGFEESSPSWTRRRMFR
jgi:TolB protein